MIAIVNRRENHIKKKEVGCHTCKCCGSDLKADRKDFFRIKTSKLPSFVPHDHQEPVIKCPVCLTPIKEIEFNWVDEEIASLLFLQKK